ncbi:sensor histidine kinase [Konateibacter massiliensis]|uniref:sensor histidine kinase n=1 Tax=Konateibacter massiliensis TaxID=2002841 RepID=UPI000C15F99B|nr:HAMP domain-containing sensor histidine kinase [Konateibacter massiliensis]
MRRKKEAKKIGVIGWAVWFYIIIIISSVMAFGLVTTLTFHMDRENSISMLGMIPVMGIAIGFAIYKIIQTLRARMEKILIGITEVAEGNLDVELEFEHAGEYEVIYRNFNKMVKELKNTRTEMQNFVNDFSHEFKTPITSIQGFAELLLETKISEEEQKLYLQIIAEESARLAELSQNTLLLSKLDAQQVVTDKKEFALDEQLKKCAIVLFRELEKKQIVLDMDLPSVNYYGNPELLQQVWMNLINNAIKFTPERGEITISIEETPKEICVNIADSGIGMDEETKKHIFEKYYQGDASHATRGYGLGLSIVARIVALCSGSILVTSELECGSTFTVRLVK